MKAPGCVEGAMLRCMQMFACDCAVCERASQPGLQTDKAPDIAESHSSCLRGEAELNLKPIQIYVTAKPRRLAAQA